MALHRALGKTPLGRPLAGWLAVERWPAIVGARIAARTEALEWRDGQLLVEVFGAVWMAELTLQKRALIVRVQEALGNDAVASLHFVPTDHTPAAARPGQTGPPPAPVPQVAPGTIAPRTARARTRHHERSRSGKDE